MIHSGITAKKVQDFLKYQSALFITVSVKAKQEKALADIIKEIAFNHTFYGYRRIHLAIKRLGIHVNHKRIYRIYKSLSLQRQKPRKNKKQIVLMMPLTEALFCNNVCFIDMSILNV